MNLGLWMCGILVIPSLAVGVFFAALKENAAKFVSGFNSLPRKEQERYDKAAIARDVRNQCFASAALMAVGAVLSRFITPYMAVPAYVIWAILFFRDVHFDARKAFEKYRIS